MLFIHWKKTYDIPNISYETNSSFKRSRKAKFFFLSDFVFKLIHKYSFQRIIFSYMGYLFNKRLTESCLNLSNTFYNKQVYLRNSYFNKQLKIFLELEQMTLENTIKKLKVKLRVRYLWHQSYFTTLFKILKRKVKMLKNKKIIMIFNYYINHYYSNLKSNLFYFIKRQFFFYTKITLQKRIRKIKSNDHDHDFIFYKIFAKKKRIKKKLIYFGIKVKFWTLYLHSSLVVFYKIAKSFSKKKRDYIDVILKKISKIENFFTNLITKLKYKDIYSNENDINVYSIQFKTILNTFHTTLYYFMFMNKMNHIKSYNYLNYFTYLNLNFKRHIIQKYKKNLFNFQERLSNVRWKHRKTFYIFLNRLLTGRTRFIGPSNKIKLFRYITVICFKIRDAFMYLEFSNAPFYFKKLSFFYNPFKIRKELLFCLGKRRYKDEFLFSKNKKWMLNYYFRYNYNINLKKILWYYKIINKKYKIKLLKDLFLFLEYNVSIFLNKYLSFFSHNEIYLNKKKLDLKSFLFIGDLLECNSDINYYYYKYILFFNFIYFIDPVKLKNKYAFLKKLYKKTFSFYNKFIFLKNNNYILLNKYNIKNIISKEINYWINFFSNLFNIIKHFKTSYKICIKSLLFLNYKYNLYLNRYNVNDLNKPHINYFNTKNIDFSYLLHIYSIGKNYKKYSFIPFKKTYLKQTKYLKPRNKEKVFYKLFINNNFLDLIEYHKRTLKRKPKKDEEEDIYEEKYKEEEKEEEDEYEEEDISESKDKDVEKNKDEEKKKDVKTKKDEVEKKDEKKKKKKKKKKDKDEETNSHMLVLYKKRSNLKTFFNKNVHNVHFLKKYNLLLNKDTFIKMIYKSNY